ncbi:hypothetical protein WCLP8_480003 [uncultured Gammaproteobacteria bacterium]
MEFKLNAIDPPAMATGGDMGETVISSDLDLDVLAVRELMGERSITGGVQARCGTVRFRIRSDREATVPGLMPRRSPR